MILWTKKHIAHIDILLSLFCVIAGYLLDKYGLIPGREINLKFILVISSYFFLIISALTKIIMVKNNHDIQILKDERDCYKKIVIETADNAIEKIRNKVMQTAKHLQFYNQPIKSDRITVYALFNDSFFALSRFSLNPAYQKISSDKKYPLDKGCIARGYEDGFFYDSGKNFPNPFSNFNEYKDYTRNNYHYSHAEVKAMSMHSTCYAVKRVYKEEKCLGVIVLESTQPNRFNEADAKKHLDKLAARIYYILELLDIKAKELSNNVILKR